MLIVNRYHDDTSYRDLPALFTRLSVLSAYQKEGLEGSAQPAFWFGDVQVQFETGAAFYTSERR